MKVSTSVLALILGAAAAVPASAQFGYKSGSGKKEQDKQQQQPQQPAAAEGQVRPSAQALKAIVALQTAVNSKDPAAIQAAVQAAQAAATTKEDRYLIAQLQLNAAVAANDDSAAAAAVDAIAASAYLEKPRVAQLYATLGKKAIQSKQYALADSLLTKAVALQPSADLLLLQGDARLAAGKKAEALAVYQQVIQARTAAGQKPEEDLYKRVVQAAYDARLPSAGDLALQWVTAYPNAESWRNSIAIYRNSAKPDLEGTVDLLRLMRAAGTLNRSADLNLYVEALVEQSNFIEAQNAVDQAMKTPGTDSGEVQKLAAMLQSKPKVTAAELAAAAKSAQSGMALLRIGDRYYGLGEYAKAAETYGAAKAKGADSNLVNLRTGIALAAAGNKAGASSALSAVTGPRAGIAKYWLLYLQTKA